MTDLLLILLPYMMKVSKDPLRYWYYIPLALVGFLADILMNNTTIPIFLDKTVGEEWTFSTRLERLCSDETDDVGRKAFYIAVSQEVNRVAGFTHIENATQYELVIRKKEK